MGDLKRGDNQYMEVEKFSDYELTQCIAYEMAIRNPKYKKKANEIVQYYRDNKKYIDILFHHELEQYEKEELAPVASNGKIYLGTPLSRYHCLYDMVKHMDIIPLDDEDYKLSYADISIFGKEFYTIISSVFQVHRKEWKDDMGCPVVGTMGEENLRVGITLSEQYQGFRMITMISDLEHNIFMDIEPNEMRTVDQYNQYIKSSKDENLRGVMSERLVKTNFKRPLIKVDRLKSIDTRVELDLHKSLDELIAYVTHIKESINHNRTILKSPLELLGELLEPTDTKLSKKKLADKFFVYDYVKARLEEIEKLNIGTRKTFEEEVAQIKSSPFLDGSDKVTQINMLKKDLRENMIHVNIDEILEEKELTGSVLKGTAKRYYYEMKPYIEDEKYKELITGILT